MSDNSTGRLELGIVSKVIKAEIGEIISLSYFLAKRIKSQRGRN
jgi:hypothetical protein